MLSVAGKAARRSLRYDLVRLAADLALDKDTATVTPGLRQALDAINARGNALDTAYSCFLRKCDSLADAKLVHGHAIAAGCDGGTFVGNVLVQTYDRCGDLAAAQSAFRKIRDKNVYSWNFGITAFVERGHFDEAVGLFCEMERCNVQPNRVTYLAVLGACSGLRDLDEARAVHARIREGYPSGMEEDMVLCNALIHTFAKCGSVGDGKAVFEAMPKKDVVSWTSMISCYAQDGQRGCREALELFRRMDVKPTEVTFVSVLDACSSLGDLEEGRRIHAGIVAAKLQSRVFAGQRLGNALVNMYWKCGSLQDAKEVFDQMEDRSVSGWNAMIGAFAQQGRAAGAVHAFRLMELDGVKPNGITFTSLLTAFLGKEMLSLGTELEKRIQACEVEADIILVNTFITSYSKCDNLEASRRVFETMTRTNTQSWNAIIGACVQHGRMDEALGYFDRMDARKDEVTFIIVLGACCDSRSLATGVAIHELVLADGFEQDPVVGSALVNMYAKCCSLDSARSVFDALVWKTVVSWTAMIEAYVQSGYGTEALKLFRLMELEGCKANDVTFASVLGACTTAGDLTQGKAIQSRVVPSDGILVALVTLYAKCGKFGYARQVFDKIKSKSLVAWNAMLSASSHRGQGLETLSLFHSMLLLGTAAPNSVTFMSVFPGCSHTGLMDSSCGCFRSMVSDHGIAATVDLYGTMVDLLARQGHLDEAEDLIDNMPYHPDVVSWTSLLGACKTSSDAVRASRVATKVMELDRLVSAPYSLLTNVFSAEVDELFMIEGSKLESVSAV